MSAEIVALATSAAVVGTVHTLLGPDHYVPFMALGRARGWGKGRTLRLVFACGVGHVGVSVLLAVAGVALGASLLDLERFDAVRGDAAGWILLAFGAAYALWGIRKARRSHVHSHAHVHADGTMHAHRHGHGGEHAHAHGSAVTGRGPVVWALVLIFVLGPCEALLPLLVVPVARGDTGGAVLVAGTFGATTLFAMVGAVWVGLTGAAWIRAPWLGRWGHSVAGAVVMGCGAAVLLGL
jgi:ABC-type nickel/cobalt efflux system permease component RcnA